MTTPCTSTVRRRTTCSAIVWGVLSLGDESTKQTDLMRDQTELVEQQNTILACYSEQEVDFEVLTNALFGFALDLSVPELNNLRKRFRECRGE